MKKIIALFALLFLIVLQMSAQSITPLASKDMVNYESVADRLTTILNQRITNLGETAAPSNPILIVYPKITIRHYDRTSYPPIRFHVDFDVTLHVANIYDCREFANSAISLTGKGGSLEEALLTAVANIDSYSDIDNVICEGLSKARSYYNSASSTILESASQSINKNQWDTAIMKLNSIPECSPDYQEAQEELLIVYDSLLGTRLQQNPRGGTNSINIEREIYDMMCNQSSLFKKLAPRNH